MSKLILSGLLSVAFTTPSLAIPYRQALAICQGEAAQAMSNGVGDLYAHGHHGIIGFWVLQSKDKEHEDAIVRGCLAKYGFY
jgi:hypothetical protein